MRINAERDEIMIGDDFMIGDYWLTPDQAGELLKLTGSRVKQLIHQGDLPCQKIGARHGLHLVRRSDVLSLNERRRQAAKAKPKKSRKERQTTLNT